MLELGNYRELLNRILGPGLLGRLVKGTSWNTVAFTLEKLFAIALSIVLARLLGREDFGKYGLVITTVMMFSLTSSSGLGMTSTRVVAELYITDKQRLSRIHFLLMVTGGLTGGLLVLILVGMSSMVVEYALKAKELMEAFQWVLLIIIPIQFSAIYSGVLRGFQAFNIIAYSRFYVSLVRFMLVVLGAYLGGIFLTLVMVSVSYFVELFIVGVMTKNLMKRHEIPRAGWRGAWEEKGILLNVSFPAMLNGLIISFFNWLSNAFLAWQPGGYSALGVYNAANQWRMLILFLPGRIGEVAMPMMTSLLGTNQVSKFRRLFKMNLLFSFLLALGFAIIISLAGSYIMRLYGKEFTEGYWILVVLALTGVIQVMVINFSNALVSLNRFWLNTISGLIWGLALLGLSWYLIPGHKALGLAFAGLFAYLLQSISNGIMVISGNRKLKNS